VFQGKEPKKGVVGGAVIVWDWQEKKTVWGGFRNWGGGKDPRVTWGERLFGQSAAGGRQTSHLGKRRTGSGEKPLSPRGLSEGEKLENRMEANVRKKVPIKNLERGAPAEYSTGRNFPESWTTSCGKGH